MVIELPGPNLCAAIILLVHVWLGIIAIESQSPVWDEIVYPAAGYDLLHYGTARMSADHPPLAKVFFALPLFAFSPSTLNEVTDSFRSGFKFVHQNRISPAILVKVPRYVSLTFSLMLALLIFASSKSYYGSPAALFALLLYASHPTVMSRASLALLEMPLAFWLALSAFGFWKWQDSGKLRWQLLWVPAWAAALLTKVTAMVLLPVWLFKALSAKKGVEWVALGLAGCAGLCEIFHRLIQGGSWFHSILLRHNDLLTSRFPIYYFGNLFDQALWGSGLIAWLIKQPLGFLLILLLSAFAVWRIRDSRAPTRFSVAVIGITAMLMVIVRSIIATGQYFFVYPFLCWLCAAGFNASGLWLRRILVIFGLWSFFDGAAVRNDPLAYFNLLVGGPEQGWRYLADSDQDWGQGLPLLAKWMKTRQMPHVLLAYSGAGDPRMYGIHYQDVISPALITEHYRGETFDSWPGGVHLAVGTKVLQSEPYWLGWLRKRTPTSRLGGSIFIYDLTHDPEALARTVHLYEATGRQMLGAQLRTSVE